MGPEVEELVGKHCTIEVDPLTGIWMPLLHTADDVLAADLAQGGLRHWDVRHGEILGFGLSLSGHLGVAQPQHHHGVKMQHLILVVLDPLAAFLLSFSLCGDRVDRCHLRRRLCLLRPLPHHRVR